MPGLQVDTITNSAGTGSPTFPFGVAGLGANVRASEGAGTTTLVVGDNHQQIFALSADRTVKLPSTGVNAGDVWIMNERAEAFYLGVQSSDATPVGFVSGGSITFVALVNTPTGGGDWIITSSTWIQKNLETNVAAVSLASGSYTDTGTLTTATPGLYELEFCGFFESPDRLMVASIAPMSTAGSNQAGVVYGQKGAYSDIDMNDAGGGSRNQKITLFCTRLHVVSASQIWYANAYGVDSSATNFTFTGKLSARKVGN